MDRLRRDFKLRSREVLDYVRMLRFVDENTASLQGDGRIMQFNVELFRVMKAGTFLHLYNLVEATVNQCLRRVGESIRDEGVTYDRLTELWRKAWLRQSAGTEQLLNPENRLQCVLEVCDVLVSRLAIDFIPTANGGNLDDREIESVAKRYGIALSIRPKVKRSVKHEVLDDKGALGLIKAKRNNLAHGLESFSDCGGEHSVGDIRRFAIVTILYLEDVIDSFADFIALRSFAIA